MEVKLLCNSPLDTTDIYNVDSYPYAVILTPNDQIQIYEWADVVEDAELLQQFKSQDWDQLLCTCLPKLKKQIINCLEEYIYFPPEVEFAEIPSILLEGILPEFPMSKSRFSLKVSYKYVFLDSIYVDNFSEIYFNNGRLMLVLNKFYEEDDNENLGLNDIKTSFPPTPPSSPHFFL